MSVTMAKKKPEKPANRHGKALNVWLPVELLDAFEQYIESSRPRVSKTSAVEVALSDFLKAKGYWPPPTTPD